MKTIRVNLNQSSIQNAIAQLEKEKQKLRKQIVKSFLNKCAVWFIDRANYYVSTLKIGDIVIEEIEKSWNFVVNDNICIIKNTQQHAVYVEFGVGVVGQARPHPNASEADYEYNVDSPYKGENGEWKFFTEEQWLDIPMGDLVYKATYTDKDNRKNPRDRLFVVTMGTQGAMYAYNALMDLKLAIPSLWKETKQKYWG